MKENHEWGIRSYLAAASYAADKRDFGNMFSYLRLVLAILEAEGFDTESLLPSKRPSYAAFMESFCGEKQIDLSIDKMMRTEPLHPLVTETWPDKERPTP